MEVINPPRVEEQSELPAVVTAATLNELLRKNLATSAPLCAIGPQRRRPKFDRP